MYIRPILEYSSVVWAPYTKRKIDKLEAAQRCATRFVTSNYTAIATSSVTAMMETLNWNSLHARRNILRLIIFYKILHNMVYISTKSIITSATADYTRGHNLLFSRINAYKYMPFLSCSNELMK